MHKKTTAFTQKNPILLLCNGKYFNFFLLLKRFEIVLFSLKYIYLSIDAFWTAAFWTQQFWDTWNLVVWSMILCSVTLSSGYTVSNTGVFLWLQAARLTFLRKNHLKEEKQVNKKGYAVPLMRLILPGSVNWIGCKTLLTGQANTISPPPLGGIPLRLI